MARKTPFYITSEECDVPLKQRPEVSPYHNNHTGTPQPSPPGSRWQQGHGRERGFVWRYEEAEDRQPTGLRLSEGENLYWGRGQIHPKSHQRRAWSFEEEEEGKSDRYDEVEEWRHGQLQRDEPEERGRRGRFQEIEDRGRARRGGERRQRRESVQDDDVDDGETLGPPPDPRPFLPTPPDPRPFLPTPHPDLPTPRHSLPIPKGNVHRQSSTEESPKASTPTPALAPPPPPPPPPLPPFSFSRDYQKQLRQPSYADPFIRLTATGFSFSRDYVKKNLGRSVSLPSHLHDYTPECWSDVMATVGTHYHTSGTTRMAATGGVSRLAMMQARIQEQLMHEKESRLLQMAARHEAEREDTIQRVTRSSTSNLSSSLSSISSLNSSMGGQGRVRKLFEERRTNGYGHSPVGRDKSYPLEPMRGGGGSGGRPPVKPVKGVVRQRGVSVDRGRTNYDQEAMRRTRSHAGLQNSNYNNVNNNYEPRSPARTLRPPQGKSLSHHKSTSSLLDANQNYNGRASSSSSGVYSRGPSRDPSPAPSPSPSNRFGFRGPPSRGPSPAPPHVSGSPARGPATTRRAPLTSRYSDDRIDAPRTKPQPRQPPVAPPRQQPCQQPRQPPKPTQKEAPRRPPRRQPSPPADDDQDDTAFLAPRAPPRSQSKGVKKGVPAITKVRSVDSSMPRKPIIMPKPTKVAPAKAPPAASRPSKPPPGMAGCKICGRNFNEDRLEKHQTICSKNANKAKKRKVFDPVKMRTKGTESEKFVKKGLHLKPTPKPKKKDWRKQHEDFIATIRAAKTGGEPPPTDNSDYVECPHCGRKFSESVADRHIPKCASIKSNKPIRR
ncbi:hypothetical protein Pmani_035071 [Petrolisthes manimaculis]|uniref:C2HC/C3H-type domain-containing protein n=1 Tax=Petrolisthes manimaculis TaxID=1843537 RepID=A0AAE1TNS4_9EUCA|nr:hypothetical protein Pmani_035071 [Petrolisthes manimaculis]